MRILVADDEPNTRDALAEVLREEGHAVTTVSSGRLAVESLGAIPFDLVITDLNMPDVDGLEVIEETRAVQPETAIVVITAYGERFSRSYLETGEIVLLSKPFRLSEILAAVETVAARRSARLAAGAKAAPTAGVVANAVGAAAAAAADVGETAEHV
ncbi:MAG: response regulator [Deltaproteobacteria bacterium]|nr:response regulator [Deltaproteobacteria bacterium]